MINRNVSCWSLLRLSISISWCGTHCHSFIVQRIFLFVYSYWKFIEFTQFTVIGFMFMKKFDRRTKIINFVLCGLISLPEILTRVWWGDYADHCVVYLRVARPSSDECVVCAKLYDLLDRISHQNWIVYQVKTDNVLYITIYTALLILALTRWRGQGKNKHSFLPIGFYWMSREIAWHSVKTDRQKRGVTMRWILCHLRL